MISNLFNRSVYFIALFYDIRIKDEIEVHVYDEKICYNDIVVTFTFWLLITMRWLTLLLLLLLVYFSHTFYYGKNGYLDYQKLTKQVHMQQQLNLKLKQRNQGMYAELGDLRNGTEAVEERSRSELGMIKKGETFYHLVENE